MARGPPEVRGAPTKLVKRKEDLGRANARQRRAPYLAPRETEAIVPSGGPRVSHRQPVTSQLLLFSHCIGKRPS